MPRFNFVEIILVGLICVVIDIMSFFADILAGVGGFFIQGTAWLVFVFWFKIKGVENEVKMGKIFKKVAVQALPFVPTYTATFLFTAYITNKEADKAITKEDIESEESSVEYGEEVPQTA